MKKAYEQSPAAVKKWLNEEYQVIAANVKVNDAEIHWGTGLRSDDVRGPQLRAPGRHAGESNSKRHGMSVISACGRRCEGAEF